jgi:3-deoxy-D-manno-octulosonic-acid transferase
MLFLYNLVILITGSLLHFVALFNSKSSFCWRSENCFLYLRAKIRFRQNDLVPCCLIRRIRAEAYRNRKIKRISTAQDSNTFFSVGLWSTQNNTVADATVYLPLDTKKCTNSWNLFIRHGVFIKYEYWLNYLNELNKQSTPTYLISEYLENNKCSLDGTAVLQKSIRYFHLLFCAEQKDQKLLQQLGKTNVVVSGDTRLTELLLL